MSEPFLMAENGAKILLESGDTIELETLQYPAWWADSVIKIKSSLASPWQSSALLARHYPAWWGQPAAKLKPTIANPWQSKAAVKGADPFATGESHIRSKTR